MLVENKVSNLFAKKSRRVAVAGVAASLGAVFLAAAPTGPTFAAAPQQVSSSAVVAPVVYAKAAVTVSVNPAGTVGTLNFSTVGKVPVAAEAGVSANPYMYNPKVPSSNQFFVAKSASAATFTHRAAGKADWYFELHLAKNGWSKAKIVKLKPGQKTSFTLIIAKVPVKAPPAPLMIWQFTRSLHVAGDWQVLWDAPVSKFQNRVVGTNLACFKTVTGRQWGEENNFQGCDLNISTLKTGTYTAQTRALVAGVWTPWSAASKPFKVVQVPGTDRYDTVAAARALQAASAEQDVPAGLVDFSSYVLPKWTVAELSATGWATVTTGTCVATFAEGAGPGAPFTLSGC